MRILEVKGVKKVYKNRKDGSSFFAINNVSFHIEENEIVGIVGESGSGKSTMALMLLGLSAPTEGDIFFNGENIASMKKEATQHMRREMQAIFQDPFSTLNPKKRVFDILFDCMHHHHLVGDKKEASGPINEWLTKVGIHSGSATRYPHAFSGGQKQRIAIARALSVKPKILICDEILSALDLSVQATILSLLYDLKKSCGLTIIFISHDLSVVKRFCDRVLVFYQGQIVEEGATDLIYHSPTHPYTQKLLKSIPRECPQGKSN